MSQLHKPAEREEHRLTAGRLDELDARLGHPRSDPHGDPIPTATGEISALGAQPLTAWPEGMPARIQHLEDEPDQIFRAITELGLHTGLTIVVTHRTPEHVAVFDGQREYRLPPLVAGNIQVVPAPAEEPAREPLLRLSDLKPGEEAEVVALDQDLQGFTRRRLLDLGLTPHSRIAAHLANAFGDPMAFRVRGTTVALRKDQASRIWVRRVNGSAAVLEAQAK
jgi:DtxR family Mn-dependent transcriptional regulator